jgi:hypothetical protein
MLMTGVKLFFGSPQRAKSQAGWEKLAHNLIHATGQKNKAPLSDILLQSSFALKDVNERYTRLAKIYDAVSYYETVKLDDFVGLVSEYPFILTQHLLMESRCWTNIHLRWICLMRLS